MSTPCLILDIGGVLELTHRTGWDRGWERRPGRRPSDRLTARPEKD